MKTCTTILVFFIVMGTILTRPDSCIGTPLSWYEDDPAIKPGIPDFDWPPEDEKKYDDVACGHVALANVLFYWDKKFPTLVPDTFADEHALMLELVGWLGPDGVWDDDMINVTMEWFNLYNVGLSLEHQTPLNYTIPTWDFYQEQLEACEIPMLLLQWGPPDEPEGHWLVGVGWTTTEEMRWDFIFHDPNFDNDDNIFYDYTLESDGFMHINYDGEDARITDIIAISGYAIPEPATMLLLGTGLIGLAVPRIRKKFKK